MNFVSKRSEALRRIEQGGLGGLFDNFVGNEHHQFAADRPLDIDPDGPSAWSVRQLAKLIRRAATVVDDACSGIDRPRVAIVKNNHLDYILLASAVSRVGGIPLLVTASTSGERIQELLSKFVPDMLIISSDIAMAHGPLLQERFGSVPWHVLGDYDSRNPNERQFSLSGVSEYDGVVRVDANLPMICTHTSGTTGPPKIVVHSLESGLLSQTATERIPGAFWRPRKNDRYATGTALNHIRNISWIVSQLLAGPSLSFVLTDVAVENVVDQFARIKPTMVEAHPNDFLVWSRSGVSLASCFGSVRFFMSTFDAIHPHTVKYFLDASGRHLPVWGQGWAQSETGPLAIDFYFRRTTRTARGINRISSLHGIPAPGVKLKIVSGDDAHRNTRSEGLVYARTSSLCIEYMGEQDRYDHKLSDEWWCTGDTGERLRFGRVRLLDREADSASEGVSTIELESLLLREVSSAVEIVVLTSNGRQLQPVVCVTSPTPGIETSSELRADAEGEFVSAAERLDLDMSAPIVIEWSKVPKTATKKVQRMALRSLLGIDAPADVGDWT